METVIHTQTLSQTSSTLDTNGRTHTRTHAHMQTHTRTHTQTHTRPKTHAFILECRWSNAGLITRMSAQSARAVSLNLFGRCLQSPTLAC